MLNSDRDDFISMTNVQSFRRLSHHISMCILRSIYKVSPAWTINKTLGIPAVHFNLTEHGDFHSSDPCWFVGGSTTPRNS